MTDRLPRTLLRLEGTAITIAAVAVYADAGFSWWSFALLVLAPDLSMVGYAAGPRIGAATYDAAHTYVPPIVLATIGVLLGADAATQVGLIWLAHIGVDRAIGYGLKYRSGFKDTHLQRV